MCMQGEIQEQIERWRHPRFFAKAGAVGEIVIITGQAAVHARDVLRMKPGDAAVICDGGYDCLSRLVVAETSSVTFEILDRQPNEAEPNLKLHLFMCAPKRDKIEFVVQKATELGAASVTPVISRYCISRPDDDSKHKIEARCQRIAAEAAKQCGRAKIPVVKPFLTFKQAIENTIISANETGIICYECGGVPISREMLFIEGKIPENIYLMIGSEGGFHPEEVEGAVNHGWKTASLGKRILRCETAPVASIAIIMNLTGNI